MSAEIIGARRGRFAAAGFLLALLAACTAPPNPPPGQADAAPSPPPHRQAVDRPVGGPLGRPAIATRAGRSAIIPVAEKIAPEVVPLMGMDVVQVVRVLGRPQQLRRDPPAEVWQYASPHCLLYVFFYPRRGAKDWRVQYVEGRDRETIAPVGTGDCLREQLDQGRSSSGAW